MSKEIYLSGSRRAAVKLAYEEIKGKRVPVTKLVFTTEKVRTLVAAHLTNKAPVGKR